MEIKITERGWAGHFICADRCLYKRNTLVEFGDKRIVVSSVGNMRDEEYRELEAIGCDRLYETMVFWAKLDDGYYEADVTKEIDMDSYGAFIKGNSVDDVPDKVDIVADTGHEHAVNEIKLRLLERML